MEDRIIRIRNHLIGNVFSFEFSLTNNSQANIDCLNHHKFHASLSFAFSYSIADENDEWKMTMREENDFPMSLISLHEE